MPQTPMIVQHSFATFSWLFVLAIVAVIFCIMYFYVRRKSRFTHTDEKAGDEGEE